jgi:hypothetical protein
VVQARREYRQTLRTLQAAREQAQATGNSSNVSRLAGEIEALESALKERGGAADAGARARLNVHKAIKVVLSNHQPRRAGRRAIARPRLPRGQVSSRAPARSLVSRFGAKAKCPCELTGTESGQKEKQKAESRNELHQAPDFNQSW